VATWSLLLLGIFLWPGLLTWAIIVFFIAADPTPLLNFLTPPPGRHWLGWATLVARAKCRTLRTWSCHPKPLSPKGERGFQNRL
jgi:hypothetical protein